MGKLVQHQLKLFPNNGVVATDLHATSDAGGLSCLPAEKAGPGGGTSRQKRSYRLRCTQGVTRRKGGGTQRRQRAPRSDIGKARKKSKP